MTKFFHGKFQNFDVDFSFPEFNRIIDSSVDLDGCWIIDLQILRYQIMGLWIVGVAFETFCRNVFRFLCDSMGRRSFSFGFYGWIHRNVFSCKWQFFPWFFSWKWKVKWLNSAKPLWFHDFFFFWYFFFSVKKCRQNERSYVLCCLNVNKISRNFQ